LLRLCRIRRDQEVTPCITGAGAVRSPVRLAALCAPRLTHLSFVTLNVTGMRSGAVCMLAATAPCICGYLSAMPCSPGRRCRACRAALRRASVCALRLVASVVSPTTRCLAPASAYTRKNGIGMGAARRVLDQTLRLSAGSTLVQHIALMRARACFLARQAPTAGASRRRMSYRSHKAA